MLLLALVAVAGFLAGHHRTPPPLNSEPTREASSAAVVLEYPARSGWRSVKQAPGVPGLRITQPVILAPGGDSQRAGLVAGRLVADGRYLLPQALLARLAAPPAATVVHLDNMQAYRYALPGAAGSGTAVTLFAIPNPYPSITVLLCYAPADGSWQMRTCESIAGLARTTATLEAGENDLVPSGTYAHQVAGVMARVDALRASSRARLRGALGGGADAHLIAGLAGGLSQAGASLGAAQAPPSAEWAQTQMLQAIAAMHASYVALGSAVEEESQPAYSSALAAVGRAEGAMNRALVNLALIGYS